MISMIGVTMCTMAMVIVLSAFNGIEDLVGSLYSAFDSDIRITLVEGKTFDRSDISEADIRAVPGVSHYTDVIEESVGLMYKNRQTIAVLKGVQRDFASMTGIDSMMWYGQFQLIDNGVEYTVIGRGIQNELGAQVEYNDAMITVYAVQRGEDIYERGRQVKQSAEEALKHERITVRGVFSINAELDTKYAIVPISFARGILNYGDNITAVEIGLDPAADPDDVKKQIQRMLGDKFEVKTRYEQNEIIFETTRTEKWITFLMLAFILLIAAFNIIATLSMLVIDKKRDVNILQSIGLNASMVRNVFFFEGVLISIIGGLGGLLLGFLLCLAQQIFGLIPLEGSVTDHYPVMMIPTDFVAVFAIVLVIGVLIAWVPVHFLTRRHFGTK